MPNKNNEEIEEELATSNQAIYISKNFTPLQTLFLTFTPTRSTATRTNRTRPNFNLQLIDFVQNTVSYTKEILQSHNLRSIVNHKFNNITPQIASHITNLQNDNDIILTMTDKNMGWALVPISLFSTEYNRHFSDMKLLNSCSLAFSESYI